MINITKEETKEDSVILVKAASNASRKLKKIPKEMTKSILMVILFLLQLHLGPTHRQPERFGHLLDTFHFLIINMLLGCDSWDQELWGASNSCLTPMEIYKTIVEKEA